MNAQYLKNRESIRNKNIPIGKDFYISSSNRFRALHISQSLWRAWWRGKIDHPLSLKDLYETILTLGIETLPKIDHDGIYQGRKCMFPEYTIQENLKALDIAENSDE